VVWDPFGTLATTLWLTGGQWSGKSTVARILASRHGVSDRERAQRNRVERDRLVAADAVRSAIALGIRVIEVDGSVPADEVADLVAEHFGLATS